MPLYEYRCQSCGNNYEEIVPMPVDKCGVLSPRPPCPLCEGAGIKQLSAPTFIIKGFSEKNGYSHG